MTKPTKSSTALAPLPPRVSPDVAVRESLSIVTEARRIAANIHTPTDYANAGDFRANAIKSMLRSADKLFDENIQRWHSGWKAALADKKKVTDPLNVALTELDAAMGVYHRAELDRQREEQRKLEQALQDEAERMAAERAVELISKGREVEAQQVIDDLEDGKIQPVSDAPPLVLRAPKATGTAARTLQRFTVVDPGQIKREFLIPDQVKIQKVVTAMGMGAEEVVGGIKVIEQVSFASKPTVDY